MDVASLSTSVGAASAGRLKVEVATAVLDAALESSVESSAALVDALSVVVPAGLTFSPSGLSAGSARRFIADL